MSQLVQIKDFQFIALKDSLHITEEDIKSFASMSMSDKFFSPKVVDVPTSLALITEFNKCPYSKNEFVNDLDEEVPEFTVKDDCVYVQASYSVKSEEIPLLLKKAGMQIKREQFVAYMSKGMNLECPYMLVNKDGTEFETEEKATRGYTNAPNIKIYDDVLVLSKDEYKKYLNIKDAVLNGQVSSVSRHDLYFWALINTFVDKRKKKDIVFHEIRHVQNSMIFFDFLFNNQNTCKLSVVDLFNKERDDELSANIGEVIDYINKYNKSDNKNDFSVCESSYKLSELMRGKNIEWRKKILSDLPAIVIKICNDWYRTFDLEYRKQFLGNTLTSLNQIPLKYFSDKTDGSDYANIRKLLFTYSLYDADTGKYVAVDLSKYVPDFGIDAKTLKILEEAYLENIGERQEYITKRADKIDYNLIAKAQEEYRQKVFNTEYRKALKDLQSKSMSYMAALNYVHVEDKAAVSKSQPDNNVFKKAINKLFGNVLFMNQKKR